MPKKLTIQFGDEASKDLKAFALEKGTTQTEILRRAIALYRYLDKETREGDKRVSVTSADADKILKDIVLL